MAPIAGTDAIDRQLANAQRAIDANPDKVDLLVILGRTWIEKARNSGDPGFYLHADGCAAEALRKEPGNVAALDLRALALMNDHKFTEARAVAEQMLAKDHDDVMAWGTLSDALLELGDVPGAEKALQEMMDRKPSLPSYARASWLKWLRGDVAGALSAIRLAYDAGRGQRDHEPGAWVLTEAANIFWLRGDVEGALAGYDKALVEKADFAPALVGKARCWLTQGKAADAAPLLQRAWAQAPLVDTAWWMSHAQAAFGDEAASMQWRARAIDAGKKGDRRGLAVLLATLGEQLPLAKQAIDEDNAHRGGPYADDAAALVAWRMGDLVTAKEKSARALSLGTPDPRLQVHRGVILLAAGDRAAGNKLIDAALAAGARFDPALVALARAARTP
jgi:tetratricopeptide (TPR) repeat protein